MVETREKYTNGVRYAAAWAGRTMLRGVLGSVMGWERMKEAEAGYSVVVGVPWRLWGLLQIPLLSLERADRERCREVILAVDTTRARLCGEFGAGAVEELEKRFSHLRLRVLFYTSWQRAVCRVVNWNWVDCWLTWAMGIAECRTQYALLHDFDAVVVDPGFLERHYELARSRMAAYTGVAREGFLSEPGRDVLTTIELMVDADHLRMHYRPVDLFNRVRRVNGRRVECDILRDVQLRDDAKAAVLHELGPGQVVHPSQVVSQWHKLMASKGSFAPSGYSPLFAIPYFRYVGGDDRPMVEATRALRVTKVAMPIEGKTLDVRKLNSEGVEWIVSQIEQLERYFAGEMDGRVVEYCEAIRGVVGS